MAGRRSLGNLFDYLRLNDSHPPLDYLIHLPLARAGVDELWFRMPSVVCSVAALALFAWWMRRYGAAGVIATGLLAVSAFQLIHGRTARMYAELELLGVAGGGALRRLAPPAASLARAGARRARARSRCSRTSRASCSRPDCSRPGHPARPRGLALACRDRGGGLGWALLWGPSFLDQARGGHSDWIPRTTLDGMVHTFGRLVAYDPQLHVIVLLRRRRRCGRRLAARSATRPRARLLRVRARAARRRDGLASRRCCSIAR